MRRVELDIGEHVYDFEVASYHRPTLFDAGEFSLGECRRWLGPGAKPAWEKVPTSVVLEELQGELGFCDLRAAEEALEERVLSQLEWEAEDDS